MFKWRHREGRVSAGFGKELVSVRGRGLEALRDGLDRGRLQSVREQGERHAEAGGATTIRSITIELR